MSKRLAVAAFALLFAGCGGGASIHPLPRTAAQVRHAKPLVSSPGVVLGVSGSGANATSYAFTLATKPTDTTDVLVCYVTGLQSSGTLNVTGGASWTIVGAVSSSEPTQQIVAYRNATATDITGQSYNVTTTTAGNQIGWVCDIVQGGYTFGQVVTGSQGVINGTMTLATATPSSTGQIFLGFLGEDHTTSQSYGTPSTYGLLSATTAQVDIWNFSKIKSSADSTVEQPAAASAYTGPQPQALSALVALTPPTPAAAGVTSCASGSGIHTGSYTPTITAKPTTTSDVIVWYLFGYGPTGTLGISGGATWTTVAALTTTEPTQQLVAYRNATSTDIAGQTYSITDTQISNHVGWSCAIVTGGFAFDAVGTKSQNVANGAMTLGPVTPSVTGDTVLTFLGEDTTTSQTFSTPSGYTALSTITSALAEWTFFKLGATTGTENPSGTSAYTGGQPEALSAVLAFKPAPSPSPTPTATPTPAPTPTPATCCTTGVEHPYGFTPYGASSFWNHALPAAPMYAANSAAMVSAAYQDGGATDSETLFLQEWGPGYDYSHPVVFAKADDPAVTVACTNHCGPIGTAIGDTPGTIRIPANARPGDGGDAHLGIVQPDGTEIDTFATSPHTTNPTPAPWGSSGRTTLTAQTVMVCGNYYTGTGTSGMAYAAESGDGCLGGGQVTANEMINGVIPHALFMLTNCYASGAYQYPAFQAGDTICTGTNGVPNGALIWLDLTDSAVNALSLTAAEKTLLHALHDYGAYVLDASSDSATHDLGLIHLANTFESQAEFTPFSVTPPLSTWAVSQGWNPVAISALSSSYVAGTRYTFADNWQPVTWSAHLHILDACNAQGTC